MHGAAPGLETNAQDFILVLLVIICNILDPTPELAGGNLLESIVGSCIYTSREDYASSVVDFSTVAIAYSLGAMETYLPKCNVSDRRERASLAMHPDLPVPRLEQNPVFVHHIYYYTNCRTIA